MAVRIGNRVYQGTDVYYAGREQDETARERENRNRAESERRMRENAERRTSQTQRDTDRADAYTQRDTNRAQEQVAKDTAQPGPTGTQAQQDEIAARREQRQSGLRQRREQLESGMASTRGRIQGEGNLGSSATNQFIQFSAQKPRTISNSVIADSLRTARNLLGQAETDRQLASALPQAENLEQIGSNMLPEPSDYEFASMDPPEDNDFFDVDSTDLDEDGFPIGPRPNELELQEDNSFSSDFSIA